MEPGRAVPVGSWRGVSRSMRAWIRETRALTDKPFGVDILFATIGQTGELGGQGGTALRLLLIGVPLSVVLSLLIGLGLLPDLQWPAVLAIACVVVPVDFAPVVAFLHDERIPERVRNLLNADPTIVPQGPTDFTYTSSLSKGSSGFDILGRVFRAGLRFKM